MTNEIDSFFDELPSDEKEVADIFEVPKGNEEQPKAPEKDEDEPRKNRRHRRLEEQLQQEREANIALSERVKTLTEFKSEFKPDNNPTQVPAEWIAMYGDSPEARTAWNIQEKMLKDYSQRAKEEALQEFDAKQQQSAKEQKQFESFIDSQLENLEDEYNVDLTSDSPKARKARKEFLEMVQSLSPKDENGSIVGYADFNSTFKIFKNNRTQVADNSVERRKEIASRSIQGSGHGSGQEPPVTPGFHGWKKDFNIH